MTSAPTWWSGWRTARGSPILHVDLRPDPEREEYALELLDEAERVRWRGFVVDGSGRRFALCRAALRINLCARLGCENRELAFGYGEHGKPYAVVDGVPSRVSFNVSHSGQHGLIAFSEHDGLGVDLEVRAPARDFDGIGSRVYGPTERRSLEAASSRKADVFYRLWSLKEALIKALGTGFALSPARFEVPRSILDGERSATFRFPHLPDDEYRLEDLGTTRFAAALAFRLDPGSG